jgi:hypothetical protein
MEGGQARYEEIVEPTTKYPIPLLGLRHERNPVEQALLAHSVT